MNELEIIGTALVVALVVIAAIWSFIQSPIGPLADKWKKELNELEVRTRMETGAQLIADLRSIACLYRRLGKRWEAEQALKRAVIIAKQEFGEQSPQLIEILFEYATLMFSMHRKQEAATLRKQIVEIRKKQ